VSPNLDEQLQITLGDAYLLERELGGGGMSRVFVALDTALGRRVVVKVLLPELAAGVNVDRFRREILLAAQLQHPHIVPLLSAGEAGTLPYFIMPFVAGESLRARMTREGELPIADTVRILRDVVSALAYAHSCGVVHRDVKPDNVLISGGVAVVTDFGVAKAVSVSSDSGSGGAVTTLGVALGTPTYMAPEQATASPQIDHRADIYALGAMAYEMLAGTPPFSGRSPQAMLAAHVMEDPEPVERRRPVVPPMLACLVRDCLAKRPADRPQTAVQVIHTLDAIATPTGGTAPTTVVRAHTPLEETPPRRRRFVGALAALALLLGLGGVLWVWRRPSEPAAVSGPRSEPPVASVPFPDSTRSLPPESLNQAPTRSREAKCPCRAARAARGAEAGAGPKAGDPPGHAAGARRRDAAADRHDAFAGLAAARNPGRERPASSPRDDASRGPARPGTPTTATPRGSEPGDPRPDRAVRRRGGIGESERSAAGLPRDDTGAAARVGAVLPAGA
jgi:serine/threonine-protein kinase